MSLLVVSLAGYGLLCLVGLSVALAFCRAAAAGDLPSDHQQLHLGNALDPVGAREGLDPGGAGQRLSPEGAREGLDPEGAGEWLSPEGAREGLDPGRAREWLSPEDVQGQALRSGTGTVPAGEAAAVAQARPRGARRSKRRGRHATARRPAAAP